MAYARRSLLLAALLLVSLAPTVSGQTADSTDVRIERRLEAVYGQVARFEGISVRAEEGVIHLEGAVLDEQSRREAVELARGMEGVLFVEDRLGLERDVQERVAPALERVRRFVDSAIGFLPAAVVAVLVVLLFGLLAWLIGRWEGPFRRLRFNPLVRNLVRGGIKAVVVGIGLVLALDVMGATTLVGAVLGTAGLAGLAIGFAFRDIVENYLAGILLSVRRPFEFNDHVLIGSEEGRVLRLNARELVLMTLDGNHVRVPNANVFKSVIHNYTKNPRRRFQFDAGIGVDEDLARVRSLGREVLCAMAGVLDDPEPSALVRELADSTVTVRFFGWVDQREADFYKVSSEAIRLVKEAFDEAGIEMPEPTFNVKTQAVEGPGIRRPAAEELPEQVRRRAQDADVRVASELDEQIREDRAASDGGDLLGDEVTG